MKRIIKGIGLMYTSDVYVKIIDNIYKVNIYTITRLEQDFKSGINSYSYYRPEINLILVESILKDEIIKIGNKLFDDRYFDKIKPFDEVRLDIVKIY